MNLDILINMISFSGAPTNEPNDGNKIHNKTQETDITAFSRVEIPVPNATTDKTIPLPANTCLYTCLLVDQEVSIKVNGSSDALTLKPRAAGKRTWVYYTRGSITSLTVSNASGAVVNLDVVFANK